jgi:hypothetical protein
MAVHDVSFSIRPGMVTGFLASPMAGVLLTAPYAAKLLTAGVRPLTRAPACAHTYLAKSAHHGCPVTLV